MIARLKTLQNQLMAQVESQMGNLQQVDTKELVEAINGIHYLEEAIYYCTITKSMEKAEKEEELLYYRDLDRGKGRMYYPNQKEERYIPPRDMERTPDFDLRDVREGRSPMTRRRYMEFKQMNSDKTTKMHELEKYMLELHADIVEMITGASPEEKQMLERKIAELASKIGATK